MPCKIRLLATVAVFAAPMLTVLPTPAVAYPIDCAILLCLAGGWPSSAECVAAKAEFIRRITPWPIEPPLQVWRCPMSASLTNQSPIERLWSIRASELPHQNGLLNRGVPQPIEVQVTRGRGVDLSNPDFDFIRSIKVYDIDWWEWNHRNFEGDNVCRRIRQRANIGSYDQQGDFSWSDLNIYDAPSWMEVSVVSRGDCEAAGRFRGVGVEWTDYFGERGFELVRY